MKIICVDYNYPEYNKEQNLTFSIKEPVVYTKPDSSLLKDGKPFFIPDFSEDIRCRAGIVLRVCRLGKNIAKRFAHRYYDAFTVGVEFYASDLVERAENNGMPYALFNGFDGSAVLGDFLMFEESGAMPEGKGFCLLKNGEAIQKGNADDLLFGFDDIIEYVSRFYTLKIGDLIYTGFPCAGSQIAIDDRLQGFVGEKEVLSFYVR